MSLVIDGKQEDVPGLDCTSWLDDARIPRLARANDARPRSTRWVRGLVLHTTKGIPGGRDHRPQVIRPGLGPGAERGLAVARYWSTSKLLSGAHLIIDFDGKITQVADLMTECAFHAGTVNDVTIGIEIYQGSEAELYDGQLDVVVHLCDFLTRRFGIQRQIPDRYRGPMPALEAGGRTIVGIYGHRDATGNRGEGDPGNAVFDKLALAGYERISLNQTIYKETWKRRQVSLGVEADGVPGPATVRAIAASGRKHGMWIARPGD